MLSEFLRKCGTCYGKGIVIGTGMMKKVCDNCKNKRKISDINNSIKKWLINNPLKSTPVGIAVFVFVLVVIALLISIFLKAHSVIITTLIAASVPLFGFIFVALTYKLDQADYHKSLFENRYKIFVEIDKMLWNCFHEESKDGQKTDWRYCVERLDSIYRTSYFLFSKKTYQFIDEFRKAVVDFKILDKNEDSNINEAAKTEAAQKVNKAKEFLGNLLDGQKLSDNFPELKIYSY